MAGTHLKIAPLRERQGAKLNCTTPFSNLLLFLVTLSCSNTISWSSWAHDNPFSVISAHQATTYLNIILILINRR